MAGFEPATLRLPNPQEESGRYVYRLPHRNRLDLCVSTQFPMNSSWDSTGGCSTAELHPDQIGVTGFEPANPLREEILSLLPLATWLHSWERRRQDSNLRLLIKRLRPFLSKGQTLGLFGQAAQPLSYVSTLLFPLFGFEGRFATRIL